MKNITLRIDETFYAEMSKNGSSSFNEQVNAALRKVATIDKVSMSELRGRFTPAEWKAIADTLNGTYTKDETFRYTPSALTAAIEDSDLYNNLGQKWEVDIKALCDKINSLGGAQVDAVYRRVETFWDNPGTDLNAWAEF